MSKNTFLSQVLGIIDEGPTRWRGIVLQALVTPWMELAKHDKNIGSISGFQFKRKVIMGMLYAENAVECLKFDPKNANSNLENFSLRWEYWKIVTRSIKTHFFLIWRFLKIFDNFCLQNTNTCFKTNQTITIAEKFVKLIRFRIFVKIEGFLTAKWRKKCSRIWN